MPLEEFEPTRFQMAWISGYAGKYQNYELKSVEIYLIYLKFLEG